MWLSGSESNSIHKDMGSIPGLAQWVGDLCCHELWCRSQMQLGSALLYGCGVGWQLQLPFDP